MIPFHPRTLILFLLALTLDLGAMPWRTADVDSGPEAGRRAAVAIDGAGRVHCAYLVDDGASVSVRYALRVNGIEGFGAPVTVATTTAEARFVRHLALDVAEDYTVQIAVVRDSGTLVVYERSPGESFAAQTVGTGALSGSRGGVSLHAPDSSSRSTMLVFTRDDGGASAFRRAPDASAWEGPAVISDGADSGLAPDLIDTFGGEIAASTTPLRAFFFNDGTKRIEASSYSLSLRDWTTPVPVVAAPGFTRPDAEVRDGVQGLAFTFTQSNGAGEAPTHEVRYAEKSGGSWEVQTVSEPGEIEDDTQFFNQAALCFDAAGNPVVAYTRDTLVLVVSGTLDLWVRRLTPGLGWERTLVETFDGSGLSYVTGQLAMVSNESGDPTLVYERDPGEADSTVVFARPEFRPWVLPTLAKTTGAESVFHAPAIARAPDGTVLIAAADGDGGTLHVSRRQRLDTVDFGGVGESILGQAVTATHGGTAHVVSVIGASVGADSGELRYHRIRGGIVGFSGPVNGGVSAEAAEIALGSDAAGQVFLAYRDSGSGALRIVRLPAGADPAGSAAWELEHSGSGGVRAIDLAVRPDGGFAASYYAPSGTAVRIATNVELTTGGLGSGVITPPLYGFAATDPEPESTACLFLGDGRPRVCLSDAAELVYLRWEATAGSFVAHPLPIPDGLPVGFNNPLLDLAARGDLVGIFAHDQSGAVAFASLRDTASLDPAEAVTELVGVLGFGGAPGGRVGGAWDANGYPVMVTAMNPLFPGDGPVLVCRPADGLDSDHDGLPLLAEQAWVLDPHEPDTAGAPRSGVVRDPGGSFTLSTTFRHPPVEGTRFSAIDLDLCFGEFCYDFQLSDDLSDFAGFPSSVAGATQTVSRDPDLGASPPVVRETSGLVFEASVPEIQPRLFRRLKLLRER